jgi:hypothetical protein
MLPTGRHGFDQRTLTGNRGVGVARDGLQDNRAYERGQYDEDNDDASHYGQLVLLQAFPGVTPEAGAFYEAGSFLAQTIGRRRSAVELVCGHSLRLINHLLPRGHTGRRQWRSFL